MSSSKLSTTLRREKSENISGILLNEGKIEILKERNYYVKEWSLDGNAPKQFIKAYFYEKNSGVRKKNLNSWPSFIAKSAEKWYPHESVTEYMINRIGQELGVVMNEVKLVKANGQIRFLSKYFLNKDEVLSHGAEICGEHLGDRAFADEIANNKRTARELFTFEFIRESIEAIYPRYHQTILRDLVRMIVFDAIVGNNDRHFYNWGVISTKKKNQKAPRFAPIYDSARGLFWNFSDENLVIKYNGNNNKIVSYIEGAYPRMSLESDSEANHFQLIKFVKDDNKDYLAIVNGLADRENEERILSMVNNDFFQFFIRERSELIRSVLMKRFEYIRNI